MPMFNPQDDRSWDGNLKGYFLMDGAVKDINGNVATEKDPVTGAIKFRASAQSFWSSSVDGNNALDGGVVGELIPSVRDMYVITDPTDVANVSLADGSHNLSTGNANLTATLMGMSATATATEVSDMINWVRSARLGAPLHTTPLIIDYGGSTGEVLYFHDQPGSPARQSTYLARAVSATHQAVASCSHSCRMRWSARSRPSMPTRCRVATSMVSTVRCPRTLLTPMATSRSMQPVSVHMSTSACAAAVPRTTRWTSRTPMRPSWRGR